MDREIFILLLFMFIFMMRAFRRLEVVLKEIYHTVDETDTKLFYKKGGNHES